MSTFDGTEGSYISQSQAKTLGTNYTSSNRFAQTGYIKAHFLGNEKLEELLNQQSCVGLRIYYATKIEISTAQTPEIVVVGVDSSGNDILGNNLILDASLPCPPACPETGGSVMD